MKAVKYTFPQRGWRREFRSRSIEVRLNKILRNKFFLSCIFATVQDFPKNYAKIVQERS